MSKKKKEKEERKESWFRRLPRVFRRIITISGTVLVLAAAVVLVARWYNKKPHERVFTIDEMEVTVKETIRASRLNFAEFPYRGVVSWEDGKLQVGYIAYTGKVTYSLDFSKIKVEAAADGRTLMVLLPEVEQSFSLDKGSIDCIFTSLPVRLMYNDASKYQTVEWNLCEQDMRMEVTKQIEPMTQAMAFAREYITSLVDPFLEGTDFNLYVNFGGGN